MVKLFIVGIPRDMEETELAEICGGYGSVNAVTIVTDQETGISQGYGFIEMTDQTEADRVIDAMDGSSIDERLISVRIAEDKKAVPTKVFTTRTVSQPSETKYVKVEKPSGTLKKKRPRI